MYLKANSEKEAAAYARKQGMKPYEIIAKSFNNIPDSVAFWTRHGFFCAQPPFVATKKSIIFQHSGIFKKKFFEEIHIVNIEKIELITYFFGYSSVCIGTIDVSIKGSVGKIRIDNVWIFPDKNLKNLFMLLNERFSNYCAITSMKEFKRREAIVKNDKLLINCFFIVFIIIFTITLLLKIFTTK